MNPQALKRIRTFAFPLNAYAYLLVKASGAGDVFNLHFGWFDEESELIGVAQERASQEFLSLLPAVPTRILDVGSGVGTTLSILLQRGHDACGITPDESQIAFMRDRYGRDFPVQQLRFEDMTSSNKFGVLLFQESAQYIPLEKLFSCAAKLLQPDGNIIMCDEVMLTKAEVGESLHSLQQLKQVATQHGFSISEEMDQSSRAARTVDRILDATSRFRNELHQLLEIGDEQIDALIESNRKYQSNYASGKYGYVSLILSLAG